MSESLKKFFPGEAQLKNIPTRLLVVAAALWRVDGRWLMHRRSLARQHGGLWEFPGGKVEEGESPKGALVRELAEELGITVDPAMLQAATFATTAGENAAPDIVILLYSCGQWAGDPQCLEGEEIGWFTPDEIAGLAMPPLDVALAGQLFSPSGH